MSEWRLVKVGETAPRNGGHGSWVETDHPAVVACMGSVPACAKNCCQARVLRERVEALERKNNELRKLKEPPLSSEGCDGSELCACQACSVQRTMERQERAALQKGGQ